MADQPTFPGSSYAGMAAGKYISAALLSAPTIENGGVTVLENVKGKSVLQTIDTSSIFKLGYHRSKVLCRSPLSTAVLVCKR